VTAWLRYNIGELATLLLGESEVFCFLAGGAELAGDEPKSDSVGFLGVVVRDDPLVL
jgi:hypothetical protein